MFDALSTPHSTALDKQLDAGLRDSVDYQILRRTLMPKTEQPSHEAAAAEIEQGGQAEPATAPSAEAIAVQAASFQQVLEQRELQLNVSTGPQPQKTDPLVLDLARNGFATRGLDDAVRFDLDADGRVDRISAPAGDDALLALDRNGNGRIDDGRELFGDQNGAANGFAELARYDDNGDGRIDAADAVFEHLRLLRFDSQGHQHLQRLEQAGVAAIEVQARNVSQALGAYDEIAQLGRFEFTDGRSGEAADLLLARR